MDNQGGHAPETIESIMYAWRITGAQFWRDMAWSMFQSLRQYLDTKSGWAEIADVNDRAADWIDDQGSYLYAEVFKYYVSDRRGRDRKSTRLNSSHSGESRMPSSA